MSAGIPLADFTALLARQLADSAAMAERRQRDEYVALAAEVEGTLEDFLGRVTGAKPEEKLTLAVRYIRDVIEPQVPQVKSRWKANDPAVLRFESAARQRLVELLGDAIAAALEPEKGSPEIACIRRERLETIVQEKLRRDAERRYHDARTLLRAGMPRTQIRGGQLSAKVLLQDDGRGTVTARLAGDAPPRDAAAISTLTIDFGVGAFPPFES